ncbi:MAG: glycosyltransferase [Bacteroidia bacterium]|nr:glycosyltransferase [Bacteroidia bacterium]
MESKPSIKILVLIDWYLPGFGAGGPIQSIRNLIEALGDEFEFAVITTNKDHNAKEAYPQIQPNKWITRPEGTRVFYFSHDALNRKALSSLIDAVKPDFLYVNSLFSVPFTFWPLQYIANGKTDTKLLLAPRGMLHEGALRQKALKKKIFLNLMKITGIQKKVLWQATDKQEYEDIQHHFGKGLKIFEATNFPKQNQLPCFPVAKARGEAKLVFHSRVSPKKNLHFLLELMKGKKGLSMDVFGPQEDLAYLQKCKEIVNHHGLKVNFKGAISPLELEKRIPAYHFSVLPTLGENFGHAIFEGLLAGKPVLISDKTPWRNLQDQKIGWDISLANHGDWEDALKLMLDMEQEQYDQWSTATWEFARSYKSNPGPKEQIRKIFTEQSLK